MLKNNENKLHANEINVKRFFKNSVFNFINIKYLILLNAKFSF
jgi:hypothetical protein